MRASSAWVSLTIGVFTIVAPNEAAPAQEKRATQQPKSFEKEIIIKVDVDRIYLTGLSMGGFGTWDLATAHPERFAAIAPICGGGTPSRAGRLKGVPVWAFHGAKDNVVPIARTEAMIKAMKEAGLDPKFTIYPEAKHDSWTETYNNPELYKWFLEHKRANSSTGG